MRHFWEKTEEGQEWLKKKAEKKAKQKEIQKAIRPAMADLMT